MGFSSQPARDIYGTYARRFDSHSPCFQDSNEENLTFLREQQILCNYMLDHRGYLLLNEVYEILGLPPTADEDVGWVTGPVDFGIYDIHNMSARMFVNGTSDYIILDFNVDGLCWPL